MQAERLSLKMNFLGTYVFKWLPIVFIKERRIVYIGYQPEQNEQVKES